MPSVTLYEQHHRTGPSFCEETSGGEPVVPIVDGGLNTIAGYEAMNIIRKGQIPWLAKSHIVGQARFIERPMMDSGFTNSPRPSLRPSPVFRAPGEGASSKLSDRHYAVNRG
jgi:hypothetical protein